MTATEPPSHGPTRLDLLHAPKRVSAKALRETARKLIEAGFALTGVFGVLSVCIGVGPIGFFHIGWLAGLVGAPWATAITGIEGLLAMALTWRWWRVL